MLSKVQLLPRLIRLRDAHTYLGMDRNRFNAEVRPYISEIPIGKQGIAFDRLDLDAWADDYKVSNGRPVRKGGRKWDARNHQVLSTGTDGYTSINELTDDEYAVLLEKKLEKKVGKKRKCS